MPRHTLIMAATAIGILTGVSLVELNPSAKEYHDSILSERARQEAARVAAADRTAIEEEAVRLLSHLEAVRYEGRRLDRVMIERFYPRLGAAVIAAGETRQAITERLARTKEHALERAMVTQQTLLYRTLADLSSHTTRVSYGLWSFYTTCYDKIALAYIGFGGYWWPQPEPRCPPTVPS